MFWGNGDSSQLGDREQETLKELRRMTETGHIVSLSPEQTIVALRAFDFYARWESFFAAMSSLRNVALWIAGGLGFWWATGGQNFITQIVQRMVGGGDQ